MDNEARLRFGQYLCSLRDKKGLTQRQAATDAQISSPYLAQLERGQRNPPSQDILARLATVYSVSPETLYKEAGYTKRASSTIPANVIERAFEFVCNDELYAFGTRLKGSQLTLEAKAYIVEVYQQATRRQLLFPQEIASAYAVQEELEDDSLEE